MTVLSRSKKAASTTSESTRGLVSARYHGLRPGQGAAWAVIGPGGLRTGFPVGRRGHRRPAAAECCRRFETTPGSRFGAEGGAAVVSRGAIDRDLGTFL